MEAMLDGSAKPGRGLALEAFHPIGIARQVLRQDLDGDVASELRVAAR